MNTTLVIVFVLGCAFVFMIFARKFRKVYHKSNDNAVSIHSLSWLMTFSILAILMAVIAVLVAYFNQPGW